MSKFHITLFLNLGLIYFVNGAPLNVSTTTTNDSYPTTIISDVTSSVSSILLETSSTISTLTTTSQSSTTISETTTSTTSSTSDLPLIINSTSQSFSNVTDMKLQDASSFKDQIFEQMESQIVNGNCYYEDYYIFEDGIKRNMTLDQKTTIDTFNSETTKFMKDWIFGDEGWQKSSPNVTSNIEDWPQVPCLCAYCKNETSLGPK